MFNDRDFNIKKRRDYTAHRQGTLVRFIDAIHTLQTMKHRKGFIKFDSPDDWEPKYNQKMVEEMFEILDEISLFDTVKIGDLYLTSGGRIVLDKGYGESFTDGDKVVCKIGELTTGMKYETFIKKLREVAEEKKKIEIQRQ